MVYAIAVLPILVVSTASINYRLDRIVARLSHPEVDAAACPDGRQQNCPDVGDSALCASVFPTPDKCAGADKHFVDLCLNTCKLCCNDPNYNCINDPMFKCEGNDALCASTPLLMQQHCPAMCGYCNGIGCKDRDKDCVNYKDYCKYDDIKWICLETCGACNITVFDN